MKTLFNVCSRVPQGHNVNNPVRAEGDARGPVQGRGATAARGAHASRCLGKLGMTILPLLWRGLGGGALAIAAIAAVSCQNKEESFDAATSAEMVQVQFSPEIPGGIKPSGIKPLSSGGGGVGNLDGQYALRYILEVYEGNTLVPGSREVKVAGDYTAQVNFAVTLPAATYKFVFWADFVDKTEATAHADNPEDIADLTYNTHKAGGLTDIEWITPNGYYIGSDLRDAYYACETIDLSTTVNNRQVTLHRPFGKLRVLATDVHSAVQAGTINPSITASLTYTHASPPTFRKSFNALAGTPNASPTIAASGALTCTATHEPGKTTVDGKDYDDVYLLAFDYFLAPGDLTAVAFDIALSDGVTTSPVTSVTGASVGANKLTTAVGGVLANTASMEVSITDNFGSSGNTIIVSRLPTPAGLKLQQLAVSGTAAPLAWKASLDWEPVAEATGYEIDVNGTIHSATADAAVIDGLAEKTAYSWRVRAKGADDKATSPWSAAKTFQTEEAALGPFTLDVLNDQLQQIKYWGIFPGYAVPEGHWEISRSINRAQEPRRVIFEELGVNMIRLELRPEAGADYIANNVSSLDAAYMDELVELIEYGKSKGVYKYMISIWSPPLHMKEAEDNTGTLACLFLGGSNCSYRVILKESNYTLFCQYVRDAIRYLQSETGLLPTALSLQNEPSGSWDNVPDEFRPPPTGFNPNAVVEYNYYHTYHCYYNESTLRTICSTMRNTLSAAGISGILIGGPEDASMQSLTFNTTGGNIGEVDIHITHAYNGDTFYTDPDASSSATAHLNTFLSVKNRIGGESWQTEYCVNSETKNTGGYAVMDRLRHTMRIFSTDMMWAGHVVWMWWLGWMPGYGSYMPVQYSLVDDVAGQVQRSPLFNALATIFHHAPPGSYVRKVATNDSKLKISKRILNDVAAFRTPSGGTFVLLVNGTPERRAYTVSGLTGTNGTRKAISGDEATTVHIAGFFVDDDGTATVTVPPNSVNFIYTN